MDKGLSNKFKWLAFVATWAVVCIHSHTNNWMPESEDYGNAVQVACRLVLFRFAVPLFFVISGYFFVSSYEKYGWGQLLQRKIRTLYVPLVIWTTLALLILLPIRLYSGHDIPDLMSFIGIPLMMTEHCRSVHFWYVRALLVLFCLGPLLFAVVRRWYLAISVMVLALVVPGESWLAHKHIPVAVFYFLGGALLSLSGFNLLTKAAKIREGAFIVSFFICVFLAKWNGMLPAYYFAAFAQPLLVIAFMWIAYDWLDRRVGLPRYPEWLNVMFFVYCMHLIVLSWCGGIMRFLLGDSPMARLLGYFLLWQTFWIDILIANLIRSKFPKLYEVLAGGR